MIDSTAPGLQQISLALPAAGIAAAVNSTENGGFAALLSVQIEAPLQIAPESSALSAIPEPATIPAPDLAGLPVSGKDLPPGLPITVLQSYAPTGPAEHPAITPAQRLASGPADLTLAAAPLRPMAGSPQFTALPMAAEATSRSEGNKRAEPPPAADIAAVRSVPPARTRKAPATPKAGDAPPIFADSANPDDAMSDAAANDGRDPAELAPVQLLSASLPNQPAAGHDEPTPVVPTFAGMLHKSPLTTSVDEPTKQPEVSHTNAAAALRSTVETLPPASLSPVGANAIKARTTAALSEPEPTRLMEIAPPSDSGSLPLAANNPAVALQTAGDLIHTPTRERPIEFGQLIDRLVAAREALAPPVVSVTLPHAEFGRISLHFEHDRDGLSVALASADPDFTAAIRAVTPMPAIDTGPAAYRSGSEGSSGLAASTGSGDTDAQAHQSAPEARPPRAAPGNPGVATRDERSPATAPKQRRDTGIFA